MDLFHSADFQGIPVQGCNIDRKPGVSADHGWIDVEIDQAFRIALVEDFRLWQAGDIKETAGPFTAGSVAKLRGPGQTQTAPTPQAPGKVRRGGFLNMRTTRDGSEGIVSIGPLFLTSSGFDELLTDLADAKSHSEGKVRMNVADIRYFWPDNGHPVVGRYNVTAENGEIDPDTVDPSTGRPWTMQKILDYLLLCLPGAPRLIMAKGTEDVPPPVDLDMKMDPPIRWLRKVLADAKLDLHLTRNSNAYVSRRGNKHVVGSFAENAGGNAVKIQFNPNVEKKTVMVVERPEGVVVVGGQRERRETLAYEPAFTDEDGQIRRLRDVGRLWGYSIEKARQQATLPSGRAWLDIPGSDPIQQGNRARIAARDFFRLYAPSALFVDSEDEGAVVEGLATPSGGGIKTYWPFAKRKHPFLPAKDPVWVPNELTLLKRIPLPSAQAKANPNDSSLVTTPIFVQASIVKQAFFTDAGAFTIFANGLIRSLTQVRERATGLRDRNRSLAQAAYRPPKDFEQMGTFEKFFRGLDETVSQVVALVSSNAARAAQVQAETDALNRQIALRYLNQAERFEVEINSLTAQINQLQATLNAVRNTISRFGAARMWTTAPWGPVPVGDFSFNRQNGLITFGDLCGVIDAAATYDLELAKLTGDGNVQVTFNHLKRDTGGPSDWTYFVFQADPKGGEPTLVRISEQSNLKPAYLKDESIVIYENEILQAMNVTSCAERARDLARPVLQPSYQQDGYGYTYPGFLRVETDDTVNEVTWAFDGDVAHTRILANFPDGANGWRTLTRKALDEAVLYG